MTTIRDRFDLFHAFANGYNEPKKLGNYSIKRTKNCVALYFYAQIMAIRLIDSHGCNAPLLLLDHNGREGYACSVSTTKCLNDISRAVSHYDCKHVKQSFFDTWFSIGSHGVGRTLAKMRAYEELTEEEFFSLSKLFNGENKTQARKLLSVEKKARKREEKETKEYQAANKKHAEQWRIKTINELLEAKGANQLEAIRDLGWRADDILKECAKLCHKKGWTAKEAQIKGLRNLLKEDEAKKDAEKVLEWKRHERLGELREVAETTRDRYRFSAHPAACARYEEAMQEIHMIEKMELVNTAHMCGDLSGFLQ